MDVKEESCKKIASTLILPLACLLLQRFLESVRNESTGVKIRIKNNYKELYLIRSFKSFKNNKTLKKWQVTELLP